MASPGQSVVKSKIYHIIERFPDKIRQFELLMERDAEFVSICADYSDCMNALHFWLGSKAPEAETRVEEYRVLIGELEKEIHQLLAAAGH